MVAWSGRKLAEAELGVGESFNTIGLSAWCFAIMGPTRSGQLLALVGMGLFGAFAVGSLINIALFDQAGVMGACALVPLIGLAMVLPVAAVAPHVGERSPFWRIIGRIWKLGVVVGLQGVGFAAIGALMPLLFLHRGCPMSGSA